MSSMEIFLVRKNKAFAGAHTAADVVKPDLPIALEVVSADVILIPGGFATRTRVGNLSL
jgi:hypothetical protein